MNQNLMTVKQAALQLGKIALTEGIVMDLVLLIVLASLAQQRPAPTEELTSTFLNGFTNFAWVAFLALIAYSFIQNFVRGWDFTRHFRICVRFAIGVFAVILATKMSGDSLIRWADQFPDVAALAAVILALLLMILRYAGTLRPNPPPLYARREAGTAMASAHFPPRPISQRDLEAVSVREAAHALLFAVWPAGVLNEALIQPQTGKGNVTYRLPHQHRTEKELQFVLLVYLAGFVGQLELLDTDFEDAAGSLTRYAELASTYLSMDAWALNLEEPIPFYPAASTPEEVAFNAHALRQLRLQHSRVLAAFFRVNREVLADLAAALRDQHHLDGVDVQPYLERVVLTPGLPVFAGAVGKSEEQP